VENLLLLWDELDDVFGVVGLVWRSVASLLVAVSLFVATGFLFVRMPVLAAVGTCTILGAGLALVTLDAIRQRGGVRAMVQPVD
jgi:hypothetical protein